MIADRIDPYESQLRFDHDYERDAAERDMLVRIAAAVREEFHAARHGEHWARAFAREKAYSDQSREWWCNFALEYRAMAKTCLRILRAGRPKVHRGAP